MVEPKDLACETAVVLGMATDVALLRHRRVARAHQPGVVDVLGIVAE